MTLPEYAFRSVGEPRFLIDIDITQINSQWVNAGAGVWYVNNDAIYAYVDSTLANWLTAQTMPNVGSVLVDNEQLAKASTLLECSENENTFYWDNSNLYVYTPNGSSPYIHTILIGIVHGYSKEGFTPSGSKTFYEGRLLSIPIISQSRDPLFFGKLSYEGASIELNNGDGYFDTFGEDYDVYGNQTRVLFGYSGMDISEYVLLFTGFNESLSISEEKVTINLADKRKQLTKEIIYSCTSQNAMDAIVDILYTEYEIPYNSVYYDTYTWDYFTTLAPDITINMQESEPAIDVIQNICLSCFGLFIINPDGKYSFNIVRPGDAAKGEIPELDILTSHSITYDSTETLTSTKIGYDKDWTKSEASAYTYLTDTSRESAIYSIYKTYNQKTFNTYLITLTDAQIFSDVVLDFSGELRPTLTITVPLKYYMLEVGDMVDVEIRRPTVNWLGLRKCEIIGKQYKLDNLTIEFTVKIYSGQYYYRITTDGYYRSDTDSKLRRTGA